MDLQGRRGSARVIRLAALIATAAASSAAPNRVIDLNGVWEFQRGAARQWVPVHVPHNHREVSGEDRKSGQPLVLRRKFTLDALERGERALLHVSNAPKPLVQVNGAEAGKAGALNFGLITEITSHLREGINEIELVTTVPGVQGGVSIHVVGEAHLDIEGPRVDTPGFAGGAADVRLRTRVTAATNKPMRLLLRIHGPDGRELGHADRAVEPGDAELTIRGIANPPLWSVATPRLCKATAELSVAGVVVDRSQTEFGFRWFRFDPETGFHLNGEPLKLRGVVYTTVGPKTFASRRALWDYEIGLLKGMGLNFVRPTPGMDDTFLAECDRAGLLATVRVHDFGDASVEGNADAVRENMRRDVAQKFNHPSVIAWNFVSEGATGARLILQNEAARALRALDPARPVLCNELGWRSPGTVGRVEADVAGQGNYTGWYEGTLNHIGPYMDRYREFLKERYGRLLPVLVSNYGAAVDNSVRAAAPRRNDYSVEYHTAFHRRFEREIDARPWMSGGLLFCFRDIDGGQAIPRHTWKGVLDLEDRKRDAYFYCQSKWTTAPMAHIVASAVSREVEVFTNQPEAELSVNGRSLGKRTRTQGFRWTADWKPGGNHLVVRAGSVTAEAHVTSAKAAAPARRPGEFFTNEGWLYGTPAALDRRVIFGSYDGNVYSVDALGKEVWRFATGEEVFSTPVISTDRIFVQSSRAVYALTHTGQLKWKVSGVRTMDRNAKSPVLHAGTLYATSDTGELLAISTNGEVRWRYRVGALCLTSPVLARDRIIFSADDGVLYVVGADGKLVWQKDSGLGPDAAGPPPNALQPDANDAMIVSGAGSLRTWDHTGKLLWEDRTARGPVRFIGDRIAIVMRDELRVYDPSGRQAWKYSLNDRRDFFSAPPVALRWNGRDILAAGTRGTRLVVLDTNGRLAAEFATEDEVSGSAVVADLNGDGRQELIFGSRDGILYRMEDAP